MTQAVLDSEVLRAYATFSKGDLDDLKESGGLTHEQYDQVLIHQSGKVAEKIVAAIKEEPKASEAVKAKVKTKVKAKYTEPEKDFYLTPKHQKYEDLRTAVMDMKQNVFCVGPTGSGKSTFVMKICEDIGQSFIRINLHEDFTVDDFIGGMQKVGEDIKFVYGVLPQAMMNGDVLILDECDAAPPEVLFALHAILEDSRPPLIITKNGGEKVFQSDDFRVVANGNTLGRGDETALYQGTQILNEAFLDRFGSVFTFDYLKPSEESKILCRRTGIDKDTADDLVKIAGLARKAFKDQKIYVTMSIRKLLNTAAWIVRGKTIKEAFEYTVYSKATNEDRKLLQEMVNRVNGEKPTTEDE